MINQIISSLAKSHQDLAKELHKIAGKNLEDTWEYLTKKYPEADHEVYEQLWEVDPTQQKKYIEWLVKLSVNKEHPLLPEDYYKATDYLELFMKGLQRQKIPQDQRDILKYKSIEDLYETVKKFEEVSLYRKFPESAEEIKKHYEDKKWFIFSPLNEKSAIYWSGEPFTTWCTTRGAFDTYHSESNPLYIIIYKPDYKRAMEELQNLLKENKDASLSGFNKPEMYQFKLAKNQRQLKDENNKDINIPQFVREHYDILKKAKLLKKIVSYSKDALKYMRVDVEDLESFIDMLVFSLKSKNDKDEKERSEFKKLILQSNILNNLELNNKVFDYIITNNLKDFSEIFGDILEFCFEDEEKKIAYVEKSLPHIINILLAAKKYSILSVLFKLKVSEFIDIVHYISDEDMEKILATVLKSKNIENLAVIIRSGINHISVETSKKVANLFEKSIYKKITDKNKSSGTIVTIIGLLDSEISTKFKQEVLLSNELNKEYQYSLMDVINDDNFFNKETLNYFINNLIQRPESEYNSIYQQKKILQKFPKALLENNLDEIINKYLDFETFGWLNGQSIEFLLDIIPEKKKSAEMFNKILNRSSMNGSEVFLKDALTLIQNIDSTFALQFIEKQKNHSYDSPEIPKIAEGFIDLILQQKSELFNGKIFEYLISNYPLSTLFQLYKYPKEFNTEANVKRLFTNCMIYYYSNIRSSFDNRYHVAFAIEYLKKHPYLTEKDFINNLIKQHPNHYKNICEFYLMHLVDSFPNIINEENLSLVFTHQRNERGFSSESLYFQLKERSSNLDLYEKVEEANSDIEVFNDIVKRTIDNKDGRLPSDLKYYPSKYFTSEAGKNLFNYLIIFYSPYKEKGNSNFIEFLRKFPIEFLAKQDSLNIADLMAGVLESQYSYGRESLFFIFCIKPEIMTYKQVYDFCFKIKSVTLHKNEIESKEGKKLIKILLDKLSDASFFMSIGDANNIHSVYHYFLDFLKKCKISLPDNFMEKIYKSLKEIEEKTKNTGYVRTLKSNLMNALIEHVSEEEKKELKLQKILNLISRRDFGDLTEDSKKELSEKFPEFADIINNDNMYELRRLLREKKVIADLIKKGNEDLAREVVGAFL